MHTIIKEFKRTARHDWCCDKCHSVILTGAQYEDKEIHHVKHVPGGIVSIIEHERFCAKCAGYIKEPKIYKFKAPEPVIDPTDNTKYWLVGVGYKPGTDELCLIVKAWYNDKPYWMTSVMTVDGDLLKPSNVRFV